MNSVAIVDYGTCNLDSVKRAVEECGGAPIVTSDARDIERASRIILPGVGSFPAGMDGLRTRGLIDVLREQAIDQRIPLLGLCLGMQLLATVGREGGETLGLGLVEGEVEQLDARRGQVPHVGWNEVRVKPDAPLFSGIVSGTDFYFVHSYAFRCEARHILATTPHCGEFVSAIQKDNIAGVQFHPEKSQRAGFQLLKNFLSA